MSQSSLSNYTFSKWASGHAGDSLYYQSTSGIYSPINVLSSGSRWSTSTTMSRSNLSMSAWYNYNHTSYIPSNVTGTLQLHFSSTASGIYPSTMLIMDAGTVNTTWSINISGSEGRLFAFYGKPWSVSGNGTGSGVLVTSSFIGAQNIKFNYNYVYDSNKGQYLYFVVIPEIT